MLSARTTRHAQLLLFFSKSHSISLTRRHTHTHIQALQLRAMQMLTKLAKLPAAKPALDQAQLGHKLTALKDHENIKKDGSLLVQAYRTLIIGVLASLSISLYLSFALNFNHLLLFQTCAIHSFINSAMQRTSRCQLPAPRRPPEPEASLRQTTRPTRTLTRSSQSSLCLSSLRCATTSPRRATSISVSSS